MTSHDQDTNSTEPDDAARLFADHDDLGPDSSLFLRAARMLIQDGKPLGQVTVLAFPSSDHGLLPFGALTLTKRNRIVFWPVLPRRADTVAQPGRLIVDHVTLELQSEKIHATAYDSHGRAQHQTAADLGHAQAWRLQQCANAGLSLWFSMLVRWSVLRDQDFSVQRRVRVPASDSERRKDEWASLGRKSCVKVVPVHTSAIAGDYVYCMAYIASDPSIDIDLAADSIQLHPIAEHVDECSYPANVAMRALRLRYANWQLVFATACPPGRLKDDVIVGFPRTRLQQAREDA